MLKFPFTLAAYLTVSASIYAQDAASPAYARILGDDNSGVEIYYPELFTGGSAYIAAMSAVDQETSNKDLYKGTSAIPEAVMASVLTTWKLKSNPDGTMVPTGEKVNGKAPPPGVALISTSFYKSGKHGVYFVSLIDQVAKKPYGMPVMWLTLRQSEAGWEQETNKKVIKVINNTAMTSPSVIKVGRPHWLDQVNSEAVIGFELDESGEKYIRSKKSPSTTTLGLIGGCDIGQPFRIDAQPANGVIRNSFDGKVIELASSIILDAWTLYQNGKSDNVHWITDVEKLKEGRVTGTMPVNGLQLRTAKTPPSIFYVLRASPFIILGLSYVNAPEAVQWAFIVTDKEGNPTGILDNSVVLQNRETLLISSVLRSLGNVW